MQTPHASATTSTIALSVIDKLSLNVSSLNSDGVFATSDLNTNNISVLTNNGTGYLLGIKASTEGGNALVNATDSSKTIPSHTISAGVSKTNYNDASYASANNLNNTWGFRPSTYFDITNNVTINNTTSNLYFPGPSSTTNSFIIDKTTAANATANGYNIALGTRVNSNTAPGKYTDTFIITAVANPTIYSITYNQNTTDTVTNMPQNAINQETYGDSVNISNLVPARDGFNFKGWCTAQVADGGTCSGTTYNPDGGGTALAWTLDQTTSSNSLTLYAMWEQAAPKILYDEVAKQSKGTQTIADLRTAIDANNSGVYEYNASVFGTASDASNDNKIYYYRGILDNTTGTYGSDGDNAAWPNTVVLSSASSKSGLGTSDTCWRIVRTTGSGGVKMIYQGKWTGSTCANATTNAQVATSAFSGTSSTNRQIVRVGYTYNSTYATNTSQSGTIAQIFGTNSNPGANNTRSDIKTYIEDTWYANNMTSYTSKLEASAGYCNDRTMNTSTSWTTPLAETTTIASTYGTSGLQDYYYGAYPRNADTAQAPSLTCGNKYSQIDRSTVDLYRYVSGSTGVSNQLKYPAALLTADEASFAGSGRSTASQGSAYHANSYLRSGSYFWLLSPYNRNSYGSANGFNLTSYGYLSTYNVNYTIGVRPSISLTSGTTAVSGTGTATDPWIVNPPPTMQNFTSSDCSAMSTGDTVSLADSRDGKEYEISKLADGKCWMTSNLNIAGETVLSSADTDMDASWSLDTSIGFYPGNKLPPSSLISRYDDHATLYNSNSTDCSNSAGCYSYYSSTTATLGSNIGLTTEGADAPYSICPKGWHLPSTRFGTDSTSDIRALIIALGGSDSVVEYTSSTTPSVDTLYNILTSPPYNFALAGFLYDGTIESPGFTYVSSTVWGAESYLFHGYSNYKTITAAQNKMPVTGIGYSVRCVLGR